MKTFKRAIQKLMKHHGRQELPRVREPFEMIVWENIAYLADDTKRERAFNALKTEIGLLPIDILAAPSDRLIKVASMGGPNAEMRAARLKECAHIVLSGHDGDLNSALDLPIAKAVRALKQFPAIGVPGAEKILLYNRRYPLLALESNGLRTLLRLGFGEEKKNYSASYKSVQEDLASELGDNCDAIIEWLQLLRLHGRFVCKSNNPRCEQCPLTDQCEFYRRTNVR